MESVKALFSILTVAERRQMIWLMLMALGGALAEAIGIGAVLPFISLLSKPELLNEHASLQWAHRVSGSLPPADFVVLCALLLLLLFYLKNIYLGILYSRQARFVCNVESGLATRLLSAYLHLPYVTRLAGNSSERLRLITVEVARVASAYLMQLLALVTEGLVILGIVTILLVLQPEASIVAILMIAIVGFLLQRWFKRRLEWLRERRIKVHSSMYKWASQAFGALKDIKAQGHEEFFIRRFGENSKIYAHATSIFMTLNLTPRLVVELFAVTALLLAVVIGASTGKPMIDLVPVLTLFMLAAIRIMPSATRIMASLNNLRFYVVSVRDVARDLSAVQDVSAEVRLRHAQTQWEPLQELSLGNVFYRYPGADRDSLQGISLRIARGELLGIVGRSGAGKTTLTDLLLGLLEPDAGDVRVNGESVRPVSQRLRGQTALVSQQFYLLDDTVRRNVAFGREDEKIDDARVWDALSRAHLADLVRSLPKQLDALVGEQGGMLSGGERQRLSIARALYENPRVLVLDEATSALDASTEAEIISTLRDLVSSMAIVMITHRTQSMVACDRLVILRNGKVAAEGHYSELQRTFPEMLAHVDDVAGPANAARPQ